MVHVEKFLILCVFVGEERIKMEKLRTDLTQGSKFLSFLCGWESFSSGSRTFLISANGCPTLAELASSARPQQNAGVPLPTSCVGSWDFNGQSLQRSLVSDQVNNFSSGQSVSCTGESCTYIRSSTASDCLQSSDTTIADAVFTDSSFGLGGLVLTGPR